VTNTGELRHFTTPLYSGDVATLLSGTRLAMEESADIHSCGVALKIGQRRKFGCAAAYIAGSNPEKIIRKRSGTVRWKDNGAQVTTITDSTGKSTPAI
jgi:hypothetical protein